MNSITNTDNFFLFHLSFSLSHIVAKNKEKIFFLKFWIKWRIPRFIVVYRGSYPLTWYSFIHRAKFYINFQVVVDTVYNGTNQVHSKKYDSRSNQGYKRLFILCTYYIFAPINAYISDRLIERRFLHCKSHLLLFPFLCLQYLFIIVHLFNYTPKAILLKIWPFFKFNVYEYHELSVVMGKFY